MVGRGRFSSLNDRFSLVFVCSGNRFRSPLAAALVRRLTSDLRVEVASVGTLDLEGAAPLTEALAVASGWGLDLSGYRSRVLTPGSMAGADLVLGFEQIHVRHAVVDGAADWGCTFTFGEFVRLLGDLREPIGGARLVERARLRVAAADRARDGVTGSRVTDDLVDPFGHKRTVYKMVGDELRRLSFALATGLFEVDPAVAVPGFGRLGSV